MHTTSTIIWCIEFYYQNKYLRSSPISYDVDFICKKRKQLNGSLSYIPTINFYDVPVCYFTSVTFFFYFYLRDVSRVISQDVKWRCSSKRFITPSTVVGYKRNVRSNLGFCANKNIFIWEWDTGYLSLITTGTEYRSNRNHHEGILE